MVLPCTKEAKSKSPYSWDSRRQDPGTSFSPILLPKTGYGWVREITLQKTGKNRTSFLLKVVGMHSQIQKEWWSWSEQILEVLAHTYHTHFQLPVHTTTEFPCENPTPRAPRSHPYHHHVWSRSGARWTGQLAAYLPRGAHKAPSWSRLYTQKLPAKTVLKSLNIFNEIKGQGKKRGNNHKNPLKKIPASY